MPFLRKSELQDKNPIISVLLEIEHESNSSFGVEELNGRKREVNFGKLDLVSNQPNVE